MLKLDCVSLAALHDFEDFAFRFQKNSQNRDHLEKGNKALPCITFVNNLLFRIDHDRVYDITELCVPFNLPG